MKSAVWTEINPLWWTHVFYPALVDDYHRVGNMRRLLLVMRHANKRSLGTTLYTYQLVLHLPGES